MWPCQREQRAELARVHGEPVRRPAPRAGHEGCALAVATRRSPRTWSMPVGTVKCHAHRGRLRMRDALAPRPGRPVVTAPLDSRRHPRDHPPPRARSCWWTRSTALEPGVRAAGRYLVQRRRLVPGAGTSPATRSCRASCRSRRWPSWERSAASRIPTSPASSPCSRASTTSASSASSVPGDVLDLRVRDHPPARADRQGRRHRARRRRAGLPRRRSRSRSRRSRRTRDHRLPAAASRCSASARSPPSASSPTTSSRPCVETERRVDRRSAPASASAGSPADDESSADARRRGRPAGARDVGHRRGGPRPDRRRDGEPGLLLPRHRVADRRAARRRRAWPGTTCRRPAPASSSRSRRPTRRSPAGLAETALVIGTEVFSRLLDWDDRSTCVLFGDGAGAVVLRAERLDSGLLRVRARARTARAALC